MGYRAKHPALRRKLSPERRGIAYCCSMPTTATASVLHLTLTGTFAARADGDALAGLSRRGQALLAYLSQQRDMRAERGFLADLLWSDRSEEQARASLRQELSVLRRTLPDGLLEASRQHVWLDPARVEIASGGGAFLAGFDLASEGFEDWLRQRRRADPAPATPPDRRFLTRPAVLLFAFEALSQGPQDAMIALGLADDLRTTLSYWRWFPVIGPEAIGWKTAREIDLRTAAAQVEAAYAVSGTLLCLGNRVKISVGLTETETGRTCWSRNVDGQLDDIFTFQEEASRAIVAQLEPEIAHAETSRIARVHPVSIGPWQVMAQADDINRTGGEGYGTPESNAAQEQLMQEVLRQHPEFSPALARLARVWFRRALLGWTDDRPAAYDTTLDFAGRALAADPTNWEAHAYFGLARIFGHHDYASGEYHSAEAVRLNPSASLARHGLACALEWLDRPEEALEHIGLIFRLNPEYPARAAALGQLASCRCFTGDRDGAVEAAKSLLAIAPDYARGLQRCVTTFGACGEPELAAQALAHLREVQPEFSEAYVRETYPYAGPRNLEILIDGWRRAGAFSE